MKTKINDTFRMIKSMILFGLTLFFLMYFIQVFFFCFNVQIYAVARNFHQKLHRICFFHFEMYWLTIKFCIVFFLCMIVTFSPALLFFSLIYSSNCSFILFRFILLITLSLAIWPRISLLSALYSRYNSMHNWHKFINTNKNINILIFTFLSKKYVQFRLLFLIFFFN